MAGTCWVCSVGVCAKFINIKSYIWEITFTKWPVGSSPTLLSLFLTGNTGGITSQAHTQKSSAGVALLWWYFLGLISSGKHNSIFFKSAIYYSTGKTWIFPWIMHTQIMKTKNKMNFPHRLGNSLIVYSYSDIKSCIPGKLYRVTGTFKCANVSPQVTRVNCKRDNRND